MSRVWSVWNSWWNNKDTIPETNAVRFRQRKQHWSLCKSKARIMIETHPFPFPRLRSAKTFWAAFQPEVPRTTVGSGTLCGTMAVKTWGEVGGRFPPYKAGPYITPRKYRGEVTTPVTQLFSRPIYGGHVTPSFDDWLGAHLVRIQRTVLQERNFWKGTDRQM